MTNEEKAKEIAKENKMTYLEMENDGSVYDVDSFDECEHSAMEMAKWKDEQFTVEKQTLIDKACEWVKGNVSRYIASYGPESSDVCIEKESLIKNFRKSMETN